MPRSPLLSRVTSSVAALALTLATAGCAATTIDESKTTEATVATSTTLPTGTAAELLPRLVTEVSMLSNAIGEDTGKGERITAVNQLWDAVRPEVAENDGVVVLTFDATIELCRRAEQFNRPADADKCFRNLTVLVDDYLSKHPTR